MQVEKQWRLVNELVNCISSGRSRAFRLLLSTANFASHAILSRQSFHQLLDVRDSKSRDHVVA